MHTFKKMCSSIEWRNLKWSHKKYQGFDISCHTHELLLDCTGTDIPLRKVVANIENGLPLVHSLVLARMLRISGSKVLAFWVASPSRWGVDWQAACHGGENGQALIFMQLAGTTALQSTFFCCWGGVQRTLKICSLWHKPLAIPSWKWFVPLSKGKQRWWMVCYR